jgi:hypothetical protein
VFEVVIEGNCHQQISADHCLSPFVQMWSYQKGTNTRWITNVPVVCELVNCDLEGDCYLVIWLANVKGMSLYSLIFKESLCALLLICRGG